MEIECDPPLQGEQRTRMWSWLRERASTLDPGGRGRVRLEVGRERAPSGVRVHIECSGASYCVTADATDESVSEALAAAFDRLEAALGDDLVLVGRG